MIKRATNVKQDDTSIQIGVAESSNEGYLLEGESSSL
jgi:hypothetical protein